MEGKESKADAPQPRAIEEIFTDLRALAQCDGALHEISTIIYRDWVIIVDMVEGKVVDQPEKRWSTLKLNNNELMLLMGLLVQCPTDKTFSVVVGGDNFQEVADRLLREFHDRLIADCMRPPAPGAVFSPEDMQLGALGREAIYYGADSFYLHQYERFARNRFRQDFEWLLKNAGLSSRPMTEIARFIVDHVTARMSYGGDASTATDPDHKAALTNTLIVSKAELREKFGGKADAFIAKFATPAVGENVEFTAPFLVNRVNLAPLIDLGDVVYVPSSYRLFESIYESPFYWMLTDGGYRNNAAKNRGDFLEKTAADLLAGVFGKKHVHRNVTIKRSKKQDAGEADVLVAYGEFVIVIQAKSKRVTLNARAGDLQALTKDFEGAVQHPYKQAYEFAELIQAGTECVTSDGKVMTFAPTARIFPVVILSDAFPSATILSGMLLKRSEKIAPVIWDIGVLDCVSRILPTPVEFLYYLKCRSDSFDRIHSDSEYNFLGYHLRAKLILPADADMLHLERDFATLVDDFMISADVGAVSERPVGILERIEIPVISELLQELKSAPPDLASVVIDLYDFSSAALEDLGERISFLRDEVRKGRAFKALSILTASGGLTYLVCQDTGPATKAAAEAVGAKHKYDNKRDYWYVLIDSLKTDHPIDGLLPLVGKWTESEALAENSRRVAELFRSKPEILVVGGDRMKS